MRRLQTPPFFSDLYRDLRDRRLLIPIAGLLVALVAVPVALSSGGEQASVPAPPAAVATDDATQVQSAVLAENGGVRDYRKRLDALKEKNPFKQQFAAPTPSSVAIDEASTSSSATTGSTSATPSSTGTSFDSPVSTTTATGSDVSGGSTATPGAVEPVPAAQQPQTKPELRFFTGRVDVTVGPLGKTKKFKGVKRLETLPDKQSPIVAFLGLSEDAERAIFVVSREVTMTDGDGKCSGKLGGTCQFIELAPDEQRFFHFADGSVQRLRVLDTDVVRVPDPRK